MAGASATLVKPYFLRELHRTLFLLSPQKVKCMIKNRGNQVNREPRKKWRDCALCDPSHEQILPQSREGRIGLGLVPSDRSVASIQLYFPG
jgi:hypothetical protein